MKTQAAICMSDGKLSVAKESPIDFIAIVLFTTE